MKRILVTGASQGIGASIALAFAGSGSEASIGLVARNEEKLEQVAKECRRLGAEAFVFGCDLTDESAVRDAFTVRKGARRVGFP